MLGGWAFRTVQIKRLHGNEGQNKENFDKSSKIFSKTTGWNALNAWNILGARRFKFVQMKSWGHK